MKKSHFAVRMLTLTVPAGSRVIGAVSTDKFPLGAVLVKFDATGLYGLVSNGVFNTCDQREAREYDLSLSKPKEDNNV